MKKIIYVGVIVTSMLASTPLLASAKHGRGQYIDHARVLKVVPVTRRIKVETPRKECWQEIEHRNVSNAPTSHAPVIFGSIIGEVIGNQFGHGRGRFAATAAGLVIGGSIAHDVKRRRHGHTYTESRSVERCRVIKDYHMEERVIGYRIKYKYHGRVYHTRTDYDPGNRIKVNVSVSPVHR